jgi:hypothetical protein
VSAILQRAGGAEGVWVEGLEPLDSADPVSGTDPAGFVAERDAPHLVAFAKLDPATNTEYLERYIDNHATNRYAYYRNRSLEMLLQPILQFPDPNWVRRLVQRIATAALTAATVDFEEYLPLAVLGCRARDGDLDASIALEQARQQLVLATAALRPQEGRTDSWSHYQRRASALAEVFAVALGRRSDAADLLTLARDLPKGYAGFRAPSALTLAESTRIVTPGDNAARDAALTSATAASHRIQDYLFSLQMTATVNALRFQWADMTRADLQATVSRFLEKPLAAEFCAIHRVLEQFDYRAEDQQHFEALPIPEPVRRARTLHDIAALFPYGSEELVAVNDWIWAAPDAPDAILTEELQEGDTVKIPDPDFAPILASRFAAEALVADGLSPEIRTRLIQRLVPMALPNPTAVDTVLARLMLSTLVSPRKLPPKLRDLKLPEWAIESSTRDVSRLSVT